MKVIFLVTLFLSLSINSFAAQYKTVKEDLSATDYTAEITYPVLLSNSVPGYEAINKTLKKELVDMGCELGWKNDEMDYHATARIVALNKDYVGYEIEIDSFCGGPHPNYDVLNITFDSRTGEALDMNKEVPTQGTSDYDKLAQYQYELAQIIYDNTKLDADYHECFGGTKEEALTAIAHHYPAITGLAKGRKVVVRTSPPHFETPCALDVRVDYQAVKSYLAKDSKLHGWLNN